MDNNLNAVLAVAMPKDFSDIEKLGTTELSFYPDETGSGYITNSNFPSQHANPLNGQIVENAKANSTKLDASEYDLKKMFDNKELCSLRCQNKKVEVINEQTGSVEFVDCPAEIVMKIEQAQHYSDMYCPVCGHDNTYKQEDVLGKKSKSKSDDDGDDMKKTDDKKDDKGDGDGDDKKKTDDDNDNKKEDMPEDEKDNDKGEEGDDHDDEGDDKKTDDDDKGDMKKTDDDDKGDTEGNKKSKSKSKKEKSYLRIADTANLKNLDLMLAKLPNEDETIVVMDGKSKALAFMDKSHDSYKDVGRESFQQGLVASIENEGVAKALLGAGFSLCRVETTPEIAENSREFERVVSAEAAKLAEAALEDFFESMQLATVGSALGMFNKEKGNVLINKVADGFKKFNVGTPLHAAKATLIKDGAIAEWNDAVISIARRLWKEDPKIRESLAEQIRSFDVDNDLETAKEKDEIAAMTVNDNPDITEEKASTIEKRPRNSFYERLQQPIKASSEVSTSKKTDEPIEADRGSLASLANRNLAGGGEGNIDGDLFADKKLILNNN